MVRRNAPAQKPVQSTLDEVARLLREEARTHGDEHWDSVCSRVSNQSGVGVHIVERLATDVGISSQPHGNTCIGTALLSGYVVVTTDHWRHVFRMGDWRLAEEERRGEEIAKPDKAVGPAQSQTSQKAGDFRTKLLPHAGSALPPLYNETFLIREFDRREQERGPIFAGFIVNDLLPRMGFSTLDAKKILRAMEAQDLVHTQRKPSPNDAARTTTYVILNRQHPRVARVLQGKAPADRVFPIGEAVGEPLSETIIRERR